MKKLLPLFVLLSMSITSQNIIIDANYGTNGYTTINSQSTDHNTYSALLSDGSLLVSASRYNNTTSQQESILIKYTPLGTVDTSFATNGEYLINHSDDNGVEVFVDASEKIYLFANIIDQKIFKLNVNGTLDTSFGANSVLSLENNSENFSPESATIVNDGIVVGSSVLVNTNYVNLLKKYDFNGNLITSFGTNGVATTNTAIDDLFVINNNEFISASLLDNGTYKIVKFNSSGSVDTAYATNGELSYNDDVESIAIKQINTDLYLALSSVDMGSMATKVYKYNNDGDLIIGFGNSGILQLDSFVITSIEVHNSNLLFLGVELPNIKTKLFSYDVNGSIDTSFSNSGVFTGTTNNEIPVKLYSKDNNFIIVGKINNSATDVNHFSSKYSVSSATASNDDFKALNIFFKNPVKNSVEIISKQNKIAKLEIYSLEGKLIKQAASNKIYVNELAQNLYILNCHLDNGKVISKKMVKQ